MCWDVILANVGEKSAPCRIYVIIHLRWLEGRSAESKQPAKKLRVWQGAISTEQLCGKDPTSHVQPPLFFSTVGENSRSIDWLGVLGDPQMRLQETFRPMLPTSSRAQSLPSTSCQTLTNLRNNLSKCTVGGMSVPKDPSGLGIRLASSLHRHPKKKADTSTTAVRPGLGWYHLSGAKTFWVQDGRSAGQASFRMDEAPSVATPMLRVLGFQRLRKVTGHVGCGVKGSINRVVLALSVSL